VCLAWPCRHTRNIVDLLRAEKADQFKDMQTDGIVDTSIVDDMLQAETAAEAKEAAEVAEAAEQASVCRTRRLFLHARNL
jgi:dTDP-4-dehydrorhamnose reductase